MAKRGEDSAELVAFLAKAMVSNPDDVEVQIEDDGELIELETADGSPGERSGAERAAASARPPRLRCASPPSPSLASPCVRRAAAWPSVYR